MSSTAQTLDRTIRVFVSSTFRDMQAERDELVLKIFPQLRRLCEERGVTWGEIDLRWGITEEQSQRGEVLPICLEEIKRCRPYFIGLLGERYGWIPTAISDEVLEREPWIKRHFDGADADKKSVTELEILHGVLNNPEMADHAFFYFRDPKFIDRLPADQKKEDFLTEDDQSLQKLNRLKDDIRQQHREGKLKYEPRENYPDAKSLGERVLADFTALIDTLYPKGQEPSPLERERMDHDAFASSRAGVYIGRQEYFDRLDAHVASDATPLVVLGESGSGKSALLSNWFLSRFPTSTLDSQSSTTFALLHFIGATADSSYWAAILRRILREFKRHFGIEQDVPDKPDELRAAFANWLHMVAARGRVVLVIDALNQLDDCEGALDLVWLPPVIPQNVRLILSTLPGRPQIDLQKRGWPNLTVQPLTTNERMQLIRDHLRQYTKKLSQERVERIAASPQAANPLYLRALVEELRVFGIHERLDKRIEHYLAATTVGELYERILERYEQNYDPERNGLVREAMSLLRAARRGLSEAELLDLLGRNGEPLPRAHWSPFYLAAEHSLLKRGGLIGFSHGYFRQAIQDR